MDFGGGEAVCGEGGQVGRKAVYIISLLHVL